MSPNHLIGVQNAKDTMELTKNDQIYILFLISLLWQSLDSSVGRAEDCSGKSQVSLGHWFESGSRENFYSTFFSTTSPNGFKPPKAF